MGPHRGGLGLDQESGRDWQPSEWVERKKWFQETVLAGEREQADWDQLDRNPEERATSGAREFPWIVQHGRKADVVALTPGLTEALARHRSQKLEEEAPQLEECRRVKLASHNLSELSVSADANCLFDAIADQLQYVAHQDPRTGQQVTF